MGDKLAPMSAKKKAPKKRSKPKKVTARKKSSSAKKPATKKSAPRKKAARKAPAASRNRSRSRKTSSRPGLSAAGQSGDLQGLSRRADVDSESVEELVEEGNVFEAGVVAGVEEADDAEEREVHTHEVPEDDVPGEYLDKD